MEDFDVVSGNGEKALIGGTETSEHRNIPMQEFKRLVLTD